MKYLLYTMFFLFLIGCNKESVEDPQEEIAQLLCENDDYQFSIEVNGINLDVENCWLVYAPVIPSIPNSAAVLKWELPGYPEWNGANSFTFLYEDEDIESGKSYDASSILGVVSFNGSDGEMFQGLGEESVTFTIDEFSLDNDYICGSFEGKALFTDYQVVDIKGSFKGRINP